MEAEEPTDTSGDSNASPWQRERLKGSRNCRGHEEQTGFISWSLALKIQIMDAHEWMQLRTSEKQLGT